MVSKALNLHAEEFQKGACAAVSQKTVDSPAGTVVMVDDTQKALLQIAGAYRRLFDIPVVGITGSVGKTSTKEMVYAVLSEQYKTHKNEGNLNNQIGMPMSVFGIGQDCEAAIFEMGMNSFGEISNLSKVAVPDIAIITNIGISHIEMLGSRENIRKAKLEILDGMKRDSTLIINGDDEMLSNISGRVGVKTMTYGVVNHACDAVADNILINENGTRFSIIYRGECIPASVPAIGMHHVYNALAAFLAGVGLGMRPETAAAGMKNYKTAGMRQKIVKRFGMTFIEDCYNASPASMSAAFEVLKVVGENRRIAVLADMLELGASARQAHLDVGKEAAESGVDILFCYGDNAVFYCEGYHSAQKAGGKCMHFDSGKAVGDALSAILRPGDTVLFKGSLRMNLEQTVAGIYQLLKGGN
ncbi:MAG TPA: UDP-N-acetylmuramoyl-tripeptide--D-alanyl-D-alanine ligase [Clostridia bacterium]|nr:UDP-N-acetylmuramoyl-tripeptide--D-alanyl-D-alanine ligase [Clostridia bacterium]